jgi:hypothetical protein
LSQLLQKFYRQVIEDGFAMVVGKRDSNYGEFRMSRIEPFFCFQLLQSRQNIQTQYMGWFDGGLGSVVINNLRLDMDDIEMVISDLSEGVEIIRESLQCAIWCVV